MTPRPDAADDFFIGWSRRPPAGLARFMAVVAVLFLALAGSLGVWLGTGADDPADALHRIGERTADGGPVRPQDWQGDQTLRGWLELRGHALLHVAPDAAHPAGRVLLVSGFGKRGPEIQGESGPVEIKGGILRRGSLEMLVTDDPPMRLQPGPEAPGPLARQPLGRWRIAGEICDGKCYPGGMRPGVGIAHRACANLCLSGEVPPVLVTVAPVDGRSFLVLRGPGDGSAWPTLAGFVAGLVEAEGTVERVGNALVFTVDPATLRRL
jgi:hypothetical protein